MKLRDLEYRQPGIAGLGMSIHRVDVGAALDKQFHFFQGKKV